MKGNETKIRKLIEVLTKLLSNRMKMKMKMIDFELFINSNELEWNVFVYHNDLIQKIPVFFIVIFYKYFQFNVIWILLCFYFLK